MLRSLSEGTLRCGALPGAPYERALGESRNLHPLDGTPDGYVVTWLR